MFRVCHAVVGPVVGAMQQVAGLQYSAAIAKLTHLLIRRGGRAWCSPGGAQLYVAPGCTDIGLKLCCKCRAGEAQHFWVIIGFGPKTFSSQINLDSFDSYLM